MRFQKQEKPAPEVIPAPGAAKPLIHIPSWVLVLIVLGTLLLYSGALQNELTSFDDDFYVVKNPFLRDFSWQGVKAIFTSFYSSNYHPLTTLTYLLEYHWFGTEPFSYHLVNVVLHALNAALVFYLALQLSGRRLTALIVSVLFAVHPMHVESVAWVAERKDVLYTFFYLLSLLAYMRYKDAGRGVQLYIASFAFFIAAAMSKSTAVSLPVLLVVIDLYKGRRITIRSLLDKVPFFLVSILFGVLNIMAQTIGGSINNIADSFGFINRIFLFTGALSSYLFRAVVPYHLAGMHYFPVLDHGFLPFEYYLSLPFIVLVIWLIARRSSLRRDIVFGSVFFLVTIFLMLQVVSVGSAIVAERYTYIPYIGLFYILGQWLSSLEAVKWGRIALAGIGVAAMAYAAVTWQRITIWRNDIVLFSDMIEKYPDVYFGYWMMGNFEKVQGDMQGALQNYSKSISLNQTFDDAYFNRGIVLDATGDTKNALADYTTCIKINPKSADAYNNRGWDLFLAGDTAAALQDFDRSVSLKPDFYTAYNNRGWLYFTSGNMAAALTDFNKAIDANSGFIKARYNRAAVKGTTEDYKGAIEDYNIILDQEPDETRALFLRGVSHLRLKDTTAACPDLQAAAQRGYKDAAALASGLCR